VIPWAHLATAKVPGNGGELRLMQRGSEFSIMSGTTELMNSRLSGSEEELARLSWAKVAPRAAARLLVGGLGMGFTLRAALAVTPPDAAIVVAELVPEVVAWGRGPLAPLLEGCLEDPRVSVEIVDVAALIAAGRGAYDAILLDVDNGPGGLSRRENDRLYSGSGLGRARAALRPGGVLAIWSAHSDDAFTRRLNDAGFHTEAIPVRARRNGKGARHTIWLAQRP
jgi:spermidine synthase